MKHKKFGFTLVEVSLFIAMTGLLFVAIIVGTHNSIRQQKYNDSVQNFASFWKDIYAGVSNVQNIVTSDAGRSDLALYGKLVVFGQSIDLKGDTISEPTTLEVPTIYVYDVVGNAEGLGTGSAGEVLAELNANVLVSGKDSYDDTVVKFAGIADSYTPVWGAVIQDEEGDVFTGSVLIVRHPRSGVVSTLFSDEVINVNEAKRMANDGGVDNWREVLVKPLNDGKFELKEINFCINSDDIGMNKSRRFDVKVIENARNASGIQILSFDNEANRCNS